MKIFELRREVDESGVSGTGTVARGVVFENGWCALTWLTKHSSVAFYDSIDDVIAIHGHGGSTRVMMVADIDIDRAQGLATNRAQDIIESIGIGLKDDTNFQYMWEQRDAFADMFPFKEMQPRTVEEKL